MRQAIAVTLVASLLACHAAGTPQTPPTAAEATYDFTVRQTFTLTHLDGRAMPTPFRDPRGTYTLTAGEMRLEPDQRLWLLLDLVGTGDFSAGPSGRRTIVTTYRRVGADSLVFPADSAASVPEFFGHFRGTQLLVVARPTELPRVVSMAREQGGAHTWRFVVAR